MKVEKILPRFSAQALEQRRVRDITPSTPRTPKPVPFDGIRVLAGGRALHLRVFKNGTMNCLLLELEIFDRNRGEALGYIRFTASQATYLIDRLLELRLLLPPESA